MRIAEMTWMQVDEYLKRDDRCVLPLGSTEQHAYLSLCTDMLLATRVGSYAAEAAGVPVFPAVPYGLADYFMAYPGTISLDTETYGAMIVQILASLQGHGFNRILVVNGHGGNGAARPAVDAWAEGVDGLTVLWHDWWKAPHTMEAVHAIDPDASHASWMEGFPWTRVAGVEAPDGKKEPVNLRGRENLTPEEFRVRLGDGSFGGFYERPDDEMLRVWTVAVEETRLILEGGWPQ